jgi:hypothetical protein
MMMSSISFNTNKQLSSRTWHVALKSCTSLSQFFLIEAASSWFMVNMPT